MDSIMWNNVLVCFGTLIYIKVVVATCEFLLARRILAPDISRKIIHLAACSWCLFWPFFDTRHATWKLNVAIPAVYTLQLLVKGAILRDPNDSDVKTMCRTGNPTELLYGPLLFTLIMLFCGLHEFLQPCGTYIMGVLVGDGVAPVIGKRFPWGYYPTLGNDKKTISGSLGMLFGSMMGILTYQYLLGVPSGASDLENTFLISLVATLAEAVTGKWDNPAIAFSVYWFVQATDIQITI